MLHIYLVYGILSMQSSLKKNNSCIASLPQYLIQACCCTATVPFCAKHKPKKCRTSFYLESSENIQLPEKKAAACAYGRMRLTQSGSSEDCSIFMDLLSSTDPISVFALLVIKPYARCIPADQL